MAKPLTLKAIEAECRKLGVTDIHYYPGAEKADRPGDFTPHAMTVHITAGGLGSRTEQQYIRDIINGDPTVPLKANAVGGPGGSLWLNAQGNGNHCLYYGQKAYDAALAGSFPLTGNANFRGSLTKWSLLSYGIEMIAPSGAHVTKAQRWTAVVWCAAIARLHGWTGQETHGHGEVAYDRSWSDPGIDMGAFRRDVMALVSGDASAPTKPPGDSGHTSPLDPIPAPPPPDEFEEIMSYYKNKADFEKSMLELIRHNTVRAEMVSHASLDGGTIKESLAGAIRRDHAIGRMTRERAGRIEGKLNGLIRELKKTDYGRDIDLDAIEKAARVGAQAGAAEVAAEDIAARLEVSVKDGDKS